MMRQTVRLKNVIGFFSQGSDQFGVENWVVWRQGQGRDRAGGSKDKGDKEDQALEPNWCPIDDIRISSSREGENVTHLGAGDPGPRAKP